jgi:IclR family pca regulon transcriptional regulator
VVDPQAFRTLIDQVRQEDYCAASEEHELGVHAVAVPLRDMDGRTVAALNVVTTRQRLEQRTLQKQLLPLLWEAARELRPLL